MSRIGKKKIALPTNVSIFIDNDTVTIKGKYGDLTKSIPPGIFLIEENQFDMPSSLSVKRINDLKKTRSYHGLMRALIQNMILGVTGEFSKTLVAEGVGYKFQREENNLVLNVGYSHPVRLAIPNDLVVKVETPTRLLIKGIDKERVGFFAAEVRKLRPPEPYKGKGFLYEGEKILRKAGKTGK